MNFFIPEFFPDEPLCVSELGSWKNERLFADIRARRKNINFLDMEQFLSALRQSNNQLTVKSRRETEKSMDGDK